MQAKRIQQAKAKPVNRQKQVRPRQPASTHKPTWSIKGTLDQLEQIYGPAKPPRKYAPIAELIYTILSQHTSDTNSVPAYEQLIEQFPSWNAIANAPTAQVAGAIRRGGLATVKAPRIQAILRQIDKRLGSFDLSFLGAMPVEEAKEWLRELPGVGPKTVGCVLMFSFGLPVLPVDTHVYRVARRLGFYGDKITADRSHNILEEMIEPDDRMPFHMHLINHGRRICKSLRPLCGDCVLEDRCPASMLKTSEGRRKLEGARG